MAEELTALKVNLVPLAMQALARAHEMTGHTRTDTINRAIQFYAFFMAEHLNGTEVYFHRTDGTKAKVKWDDNYTPEENS